jgi:hypothetical protein
MSGEEQLIQDLEQRQKLASVLFRVWTSSIPSSHVPTADNFAGWLDTFGAEIAAAAIRKTANKARKEMRARCLMSGSDLESYATATMKHLAREKGIWK